MIEGFAGLGEMFADFDLVLKIFVLMTIINFVRNHVAHSGLALIVTAVFSFFVLFVAWPLFGSAFLLYSLFMMGIGSILVDFFFVSGGMMGGGQAEAHAHGPVSSGADFSHRGKAMGGAHKMLHAGARRLMMRR